MKATIQNIVTDGDQVTVFADFDGDVRSYKFAPADATRENVIATIAIELEERRRNEEAAQEAKEHAAKVVSLLADLQGEVIG